MTPPRTPTTAVYLPDPANDETLTMSGYDWWRYRAAIEAEARASQAEYDFVSGPGIPPHQCAPLDVAPHPGEHHEFRTTCLRCGEPGWLHVSLLGPDETFTIASREEPTPMGYVPASGDDSEPFR